MSEVYEGVVFRSDGRVARLAFGSLPGGPHLQLVPVDRGLYGIVRVAARSDPFDQAVVESIAERVSAMAGAAVALFHDNRCGVRLGVLYSGGRRVREFGDEDAWWVPCGEDGELVLDGPRSRESELLPELEYDCIVSAIDAALSAIGVAPGFDANLIKLAFCYEAAEVIAESGGPA